MDMQQRIDDLTFICDRLCLLLTDENAALREMRFETVEETLDEKLTLCRAYLTRMDGLAKNTDILPDIDAEARETLKNLGEYMQDLMDENMMLLNTSIQANRNVLDLFADAVRNHNDGPNTYGENGDSTGLGPRKAPQGIPISVDRTL